MHALVRVPRCSPNWPIRALRALKGPHTQAVATLLITSKTYGDAAPPCWHARPYSGLFISEGICLDASQLPRSRMPATRRRTATKLLRLQPEKLVLMAARALDPPRAAGARRGAERAT